MLTKNLLLRPFQSCFLDLILGCEFPQEWQGEWNVEGERDSSHISIEDFGTKGFCLKEENDIYVIYNR